LKEIAEPESAERIMKITVWVLPQLKLRLLE